MQKEEIDTLLGELANLIAVILAGLLIQKLVKISIRVIAISALIGIGVYIYRNQHKLLDLAKTQRATIKANRMQRA